MTRSPRPRMPHPVITPERGLAQARIMIRRLQPLALAYFEGRVLGA
ncbi:MAG: hypothetical protein GAK40_00665 [Burkholderia plantarii]|nr:MAG: hypothetical protein GAK40_00665 [Burkholderia plantarii]